MPTKLIAATEKVYVSPLIRELTVQLVDVMVTEPGQTSLVVVDVETLVAETEYPRIWLPPLLSGADQLTLAEESFGVDVTSVGVPGEVAAGNVTVVGEDDTELYDSSPAIVPVTTQVPAD